MGMTDRTIPFPFRQGQVHFAVVPIRTPLAGGEEGPDRFQTASVPGRFVLELAQEFTPTGIADRSGQRMVGEHPLHIQALDIDRLVFVDQSTAQLVKEVRSLVGHLLMQTCHFHPRPGAVSRPLLFAGEAALQKAQPLFRLSQEVRRSDLLPLRGDGKALQPQVQSDFLPPAFGRTVFHFHFAEDRGEIPPRRAFGEGHALRPPHDRAVHHDLERRELREDQLSVLGIQCKVLRYAKRLPGAPGFELRISPPALKKVPVGRVQIAKRHLQGLSIDLSQKGVSGCRFKAVRRKAVSW